MDTRTELIEAIAHNDVERIKQLRLMYRTVGIVVEVDGQYFTADTSGKVVALTADENHSLGKVIRVITDLATMELIFRV